MTELFISIDSALHSTGIAYFRVGGHGITVESTFTIEVNELIKREEAAILAMSTIMRDHISIGRDGYGKSRWAGLICEIQKPHGAKEKMSVQAFSHLASVPLGLMGYANSIGIKTYMYTPQEWKGTVKKPIMTRRIYDRERKLGTNPNLFSLKDHDILDAIGLGRYHFENQEYLRRTGR